jgi:hypothetical protein
MQTLRPHAKSGSPAGRATESTRSSLAFTLRIETEMHRVARLRN